MNAWRGLAVMWLLLLPLCAVAMWRDARRNGDWKFFVLIPTTWSPSYWVAFWRDFFAARPLPALVVLALLGALAFSLLIVTTKVLIVAFQLTRSALTRGTAA